MSKYKMFRSGFKVNIDECYLTDEVGILAHATPTATILSVPQDNEELVCVCYENGLIDHVPQDIIEVIINKELYENQLNLVKEIIEKTNINIVTCGNCGQVFLHKLEETELTCPYCCCCADPSDMPDLFY